jgi:hypothetical protein
MKILIKIDFFAQLILLIVAVGSVSILFINREYFVVLMAAQCCIGIEQYFSSLITVIFKASLWRKKRTHLVVSTVYLVLLFAFTFLHIHGIPHSIILVGVFVLPWALAVYYFVLTCQVNFPAKSNAGHFLPHTSF